MNETASIYAADPISPTPVILVMSLIIVVSIHYLIKAFKLRAAGTISEDPMEQHLGIQIGGHVAIIAACAWSLVSTMTGAW